MDWKRNCGRLKRLIVHCSALFMFGSLCSVVGCGQSGPELAPVSGVVTLDGKPLAGKTVGFTPDDGRRSSVGFTDEDGRYEMYYTAQRKGALLTKHIVTIYTPEDAYPPARENVPAKYRINTELSAVVEDANNKFDFELKSD